jgi:hypothetical protein
LKRRHLVFVRLLGQKLEFHLSRNARAQLHLWSMKKMVLGNALFHAMAM